jgi:hypothetical protein
VRAAIGAREKLVARGIDVPLTGARLLALDVADEGADKNAIARVHGVEVADAEEWSGKGADLFQTTERCFELCDLHGYDRFRYDADGLGAGVRGDARVINQRRREAAGGSRDVLALGFRGSEGVVDPDGIVDGTTGREGDSGRTQKDYFANRKAQAWWQTRRLFQNTYRWLALDEPCAVDEIISISPACPNREKLVAELSQPTYSTNAVGKIVIDKKPKGMKSPNLADALVIAKARLEVEPLRFTRELALEIRRMGMRRRVL